VYTDGIDWASSGAFSVHNVGSDNNGKAVSIRNGGGSISKLAYGGVSGVGSASGTTLENTTQADPLSPDVPSEMEIGPRSASDSTEDSTTTDSDSDSSGTDSTTQYGGYTKPAEGSLEWHIPLNENFESIEQDVQDLAERIAKLEQNS
jgi:hypothetical protein